MSDPLTEMLRMQEFLQKEHDRAKGLGMTHPMDRQTAKVPCNGCKLCCQRQIIVLFPEKGDQVETYEHWEFKDGTPYLPLKPNGDCYYLGEKGCTIHDRAPYLCRTFDCRQDFKQYTRKERRFLIKTKQNRKDILQRGNDLLRGLP